MVDNQTLKNRIEQMRERIHKNWGRHTQPLVTNSEQSDKNPLDTFYEEYMSEEVESFAEEELRPITSNVCDVA